MASTDALNVGLSGLLAAQRSINTTGHNISNVGTDGFSRQRTEQAASASAIGSSANVGLGVSVTGVTRAGDRYLGAELTRVSAEFGQADTQYQLNARLDSLLSGADTGLATYLNNFSSAAESVSANPASLSDRQVLIGEAQQLSNAMGSAWQQISSFTEEVNNRLQGSVDNINDLSARIAQLNGEISLAAANGQTPNDLMDQRDQVVNELAGQMSIRTL
ncbi:MAG: flagellar hook-associated protein FlgK, partial [Gammaproteobacteria bacterium]|nr:flagellar hook-associated protein FlgK [Gammaproteobacteria bacterium]